MARSKSSYKKKSSKSADVVTKSYLKKNYPKPETKIVGPADMGNLNLLSPFVISLTSTRQGDNMNERIGHRIEGKGVSLKMFLHNGNTSAFHVRMMVVEHLDYSNAIDLNTPLYRTYTAGGNPGTSDFGTAENNLLQGINTTLFRVVFDKLFYLSGEGESGPSFVRSNKWLKYKKNIEYLYPTDAEPRKGRLSLCMQCYDADGNGIVEPTGIHVGIGALLYYTDV